MFRFSRRGAPTSLVASGLLRVDLRGYCMQFPGRRAARQPQSTSGFTLAEVVVAVAIATLSFGGVIYGYILTADQAQWSAYSLAAQSLAMQGVEQARAAKWDPKSWPPVDELGLTNYAAVETLDVPVCGKSVLATNYISISLVSADPPLRQLRTDCVWGLPNGCRSRGPFTNTVITLRTADQ